MARAVMIDCDPGIDDMMALLTICASPELDLRGVTTVGGNVGIELTTRNARSVLALAGRGDVPVAAGAARSLVRVPVTEKKGAHGDDGLGGITLPEPPGAPDPRPAAEFLAATVAASAEPVTLFAVGPLTDVALFYAMYPQVAARLERLVVMGGSIGEGNMTPAAEFNVWFDPEAAHRVLTDPGVSVPTTLVPLDVTRRTGLGDADIAALAGSGRIGGLTARALGGYRHGLGTVTPVHDAVAVLAVLHPELMTTRPARIHVDAGDGPSRGNTVVDLHPGTGPTVDVVVDADHRAVVDALLDRVTSLDRRV
ncbi:nucleoside hydrolase [Catellatospora citrea]|uniref:Purine nucleosidase n=1 Tax=Catellatospora citrea TaxID=53366 RepID=A0A8J3KDG2_9ACTN|nr:nucleoside hydrolase [Catellatospora citrea]RKE06599.1 pyrimidine-specific ribonucleoside hydrolase [Catellatospora citrea]GIF98594.1 purine nucleosidase [Catellatospora citrea]